MFVDVDIDHGPSYGVTLFWNDKFNYQFQRQATKIHNGIVEGQLAIAEKPPGQLLGQRIRMTELSSTRGQCGYGFVLA